MYTLAMSGNSASAASWITDSTVDRGAYTVRCRPTLPVKMERNALGQLGLIQHGVDAGLDGVEGFVLVEDDVAVVDAVAEVTVGGHLAGGQEREPVDELERDVGVLLGAVRHPAGSRR